MHFANPCQVYICKYVAFVCKTNIYTGYGTRSKRLAPQGEIHTHKERGERGEVTASWWSGIELFAKF